MQTDLDQDLTLVLCSQAYPVNYILQLKLWCFHKALMHGLRYILLVSLVVGKTKFTRNTRNYTRNGQDTFYNEKLGPKLTKNQKHFKFTLLALATIFFFPFKFLKDYCHVLTQV